MTKLTPEYLHSLIKSTGYFQLEGTTTTICALETTSGFIIVGKSACLNPDDFNEDIGKEIAFNDAFDKLWDLEGYHQKSIAFENKPKIII